MGIACGSGEGAGRGGGDGNRRDRIGEDGGRRYQERPLESGHLWDWTETRTIESARNR